MRIALAVSAALTIIFSSPVFAADDPWITYVNREDRFALNLPGQPAVEEFTYRSEYGSAWEASRYTAEYDGYVYRMTAVDMSNSTLAASAGGPGFEKRGAMAHAAAVLSKTGEVILDTYDQVQIIPGQKLEIVLADGRLNIVELHVFYEYLFILECISPPDAVPGYDVQSSLELLDAEGNIPRFDNVDFPGPVPVASVTPGTEAAQGADAAPAGWTEYVNREHRFALNLPGQPQTEDFTYMSAQYSPWKARRYTVEHNGNSYSVTVVDMSTTRLTPELDQFRNTARPGSEKSGALAFAAWNLRMTGEVISDRYQERQVVPGQALEIALPDGRRNTAEVYAHHDFLYILESILPIGAVPEYDVHGSLKMLDADGNVPRYPADRTFPDYM